MASPNNKPIAIYRRLLYGTWRSYIINPDTRAAINELTGMNTLTERHQTALESLGLTFDLVADPEAVRT